MDGGLAGGLIAIGGLVVFNIAAVAFSYGRLTQKVKDLCRRIERLEKCINNQGGKDDNV